VTALSTHPIRTLLVANRGEIARRVTRSGRQMGIVTIAVYSDADADAPHVRDADLAVPLGGATATESYLDHAKLLAAAAASGADAIHPGYGFVSENADFAQACTDAGLTFVGPSPDTIRQMGIKDHAKAVAYTAGVPVLPDAAVTGDDENDWLSAADTVGFPLLVKATAGGGGKGMRRVTDRAGLADAVRSARREAGNSFGDPTVFLERYLPTARHIEIQVFGDTHGNAVHLFERECSVQRRHQKVLEEAPSAAVTPELRARMGDTAVALVTQLGYVGAGTVEYLLDQTGPEPRFYFLEMNTRLQVEHPVTEQITGTDLVRWQLQVAMGEPLPATQDELAVTGHAIEVRLYAEDPAQDYLPTPGALLRYHHDQADGLRFEDGVTAPCEVSSYYDPMLAKVIAHAPTRTEAAARLAAALSSSQIHGTTTNRDFLTAILRDPDFLAGATHTDFLDRHPHLTRPRSGAATGDLSVLADLAAAIATTTTRRRLDDPVTGHAPPGFRLLPGAPATRATWSRLDHEPSDLDVTYRLRGKSENGCETLDMTVHGQAYRFALRSLGPDAVRVIAGGLDRRYEVARYDDGTVWVNSRTGQTGWRQQPRLPGPAENQDAAGPVSNLPGTVVAVHVQPGDHVVTGQKLVVLEAMKMEHTITAAADGVVETVHVAVGQNVPPQAALVTLTGDPA